MAVEDSAAVPAGAASAAEPVAADLAALLAGLAALLVAADWVALVADLVAPVQAAAGWVVPEDLADWVALVAVIEVDLAVPVVG